MQAQLTIPLFRSARKKKPRNCQKQRTRQSNKDGEAAKQDQSQMAGPEPAEHPRRSARGADAGVGTSRSVTSFCLREAHVLCCRWGIPHWQVRFALPCTGLRWRIGGEEVIVVCRGLAYAVQAMGFVRSTLTIDCMARGSRTQDRPGANDPHFYLSALQ